MKKIYKIHNLGCANCASKMEANINKLPEVDNAKINFMAEKITVETNSSDLQDLEEKIQKICRSIEPDTSIEAK